MESPGRSFVSLKAELDALRVRLADVHPRFESPSMELLRSVLSNASAFVGMLAPDGTFLFLNRTNPGVAYDDVIGSSIFDFVVPEHRSALRACVDGVLRTGKSDTITADALLHSGAIASFDVHIGPVIDHGDVIALTIVTTDVTARNLTLRALRESEEKLRMAVAATGMGVWHWDTRSDVVTWDDRLCAICGVAPGEAPAGRDGIISMAHPEDRERVAAVIGRGVESGVWEEAKYRVVRPDGTVRWVIVKGTVVLAQDRSPMTVFGGVIDVTEAHQRDEQLRHAQKMEAVGQLSSGIAHNFNNMLMGILPNLELAVRASPPNVVPLLQSAQHAALRAAELVRQLMTYAGRSRRSARRAEAMGPIVDRAVSMCRKVFDARVTIDVRCDPNANAVVDAVQVEQALLNMLINARDAVSDPCVESPRVGVDVDVVRRVPSHPEAPGPTYVRISISDNGIGMSEATQGKIFDPFFTTKDIGKGTGLGLTTSQAIVREHDGYLECASAPREGSKMTIYLPGAASADAPVSEAAERALSHGTETILVVDDEPTVREVVERILQSQGFTVKLAESGQDALRVLEDPTIAADVALILLDVSMPGISGRELRRRLGERVPHARVVYFTGYAFEAPDVDDFVLLKPVTFSALVTAVQRALRGARPTTLPPIELG